jgi:hypothetical protein
MASILGCFGQDQSLLKDQSDTIKKIEDHVFNKIGSLLKKS